MAPAIPDFDAVVVGAGFAGSTCCTGCAGSGSASRVFEAGGGVGGTWYWNRYPGARCDVESLRVLLPVLRGAPAGVGVDRALRRAARDPALPRARRGALRPAARHAARHARAGRALRRRPQRVAGRDRARTRHRDATASWRRAACRARHTPAIPGRESFGARPTTPAAGPTRAWTSRGRRVGVVGTGSSGVQAIPVIAREAAHLTVFQRTANYAVPGAQRPARRRSTRRDVKRRLSRLPRRRPSEAPRLRRRLSDRRGPRARRRRPSERERALRGVLAARRPLLHAAPSSTSCSTRRSTRAAPSSSRRKIREPWSTIPPSPSGCPRPGDRLQAPVRRHRVLRDLQPRERHLVDVGQTPIESIHRDRACSVGGAEYEFDAIVFATGFDAMTGALDRIDIRGSRRPAP